MAFNSLKDFTFDIWFASHASQLGLRSKHKPNDAYNSAAFADRAGYDLEIIDLQNQFSKKTKGQ
jgi:metallo-beta-lactamase class B